jgi:hypothetical protein
VSTTDDDRERAADRAFSVGSALLLALLAVTAAVLLLAVVHGIDPHDPH